MTAFFFPEAVTKSTYSTNESAHFPEPIALPAQIGAFSLMPSIPTPLFQSGVSIAIYPVLSPGNSRVVNIRIVARKSRVNDSDYRPIGSRKIELCCLNRR
jgi:hypothetical protein